MTLVKSAPKKSFAQKTDFLGLRQIFNWPNSFLAKTFFGCTFYKGHMYIFEISPKRRIF
jgi:hypothetical protein